MKPADRRRKVAGDDERDPAQDHEHAEVDTAHDQNPGQLRQRPVEHPDERREHERQQPSQQQHKQDVAEERQDHRTCATRTRARTSVPEDQRGVQPASLGFRQLDFHRRAESTSPLTAQRSGPTSDAGQSRHMRVFSGIRASGDKTLGNYSGGFRQYVATQEEAVRDGGEAFFCVVDLHSITTPFEPGRRCASRRCPSRRGCSRPGSTRALDGLRPEPRDRSRGGRLAARRGDGVRRAAPHDAVQGEVRGPGFRVAPDCSTTRS